MSDEIEYRYNTRSRGRDNQEELRVALLRDISSENTEVEEEVEPWIDDEETDWLPEEDASDIDDDYVIEPNELENSDDSDDGEATAESQAPEGENDSCFYGKDGTVWQKKEPPSTIRIRQHNVMRFRAGPKVQTSIPIEVFKRFFTENISFVIINETNRHARQVTQEWNEKHPTSKQREWSDLTSTELDAFIGILLAMGVSHNNMQKASVLWHTDSLPIFRAAMSYNRFIVLTKYIRFDDSRTRAFRQQTDKAAPIRDIWNFLNENLAKNYEPHENVTIDEQLFPYRGRTKFTQFIPSKPAKYGIKVWWACDAKTKYPLQGKLYTGKNAGAEREVNQGENVLLDLSKKYTNSGRTIVADNFFTTLEGAKRLAQIGLAYVGTIRANKRCLPEAMKKKSSRPVLSSLFGFHDNLVSICSYVPKKNKTVNMISTVHYSTTCAGEAKKPEAILYYNQNKAGVDCMDQMITHFTTKRPTSRWSLAFFYNILDVMALASYCITKENGGVTRGDARRNFITTLHNTLVLPNIENRMNNARIISRFSTRLAIEAFFGRKIDVPVQPIAGLGNSADPYTTRRDCKICLQGDEKLRRKTRFFCQTCTNAVCQQHAKQSYTCLSCAAQNQ
jgi:hypothetical protein